MSLCLAVLLETICLVSVNSVAIFVLKNYYLVKVVNCWVDGSLAKRCFFDVLQRLQGHLWTSQLD
jgi:hypothetical protein